MPVDFSLLKRVRGGAKKEQKKMKETGNILSFEKPLYGELGA